MEKKNIILLILTLLIIIFSIAIPFQRELFSSIPQGIYSNDEIVHAAYTEHLVKTGNWKTYPAYISGGYGDVIAFNPPLLYILAALLSVGSGLSVHASLFFMSVIIIILSIYVMFLLIKRYDERTAYFSLPITIIIFFNVVLAKVYLWGTWPFLLGSLFLLCFFYFIDKPILAGLFLTATALSHTSEFIFGIIFLTGYILFQSRTPKEIFKTIKKYFITAIITILGSIYYLWIFYKTWLHTQADQFAYISPTQYSNFQVFQFPQLGWLMIPILIGITIAIIEIKKHEKNTYPIIVALFMFLIGFTHNIGWSTRAFQTRYFWPIYLSIFFGITFAKIFKKIKYTTIITLILITIIVITNPIRFEDHYGLIKPNMWEGFVWMQQNIPENATLLFFPNYHAQQNAAIVWESQRTSCLIYDLPETYSENYTCRIIGELKSNYAYFKKWPFDISYHLDPIQRDYINTKLCNFDYTIITTEQWEDKTIDYLQELTNNLINQKSQTVIYAKKPFVIIKNTRC